jgi:threonine/homoserine/homoserine lactone efflux protein
VAVFWSCLAAASWLFGTHPVIAVLATVAGACYFWVSWSAWRHAHEPLPPGRGSTSRWGGGRPDERWH